MQRIHGTPSMCRPTLESSFYQFFFVQSIARTNACRKEDGPPILLVSFRAAIACFLRYSVVKANPVTKHAPIPTDKTVGKYVGLKMVSRTTSCTVFLGAPVLEIPKAWTNRTARIMDVADISLLSFVLARRQRRPFYDCSCGVVSSEVADDRRLRRRRMQIV